MKEIKYPSHLLNETGLTCNTFQFLEERLEHDEVKIRFHVVFNKDGQAFYQSQSFIFELTRLANKSCSWVRCNRREESMPFAPRFLGTLFEEEEGHLTFDGLRISGKAEKGSKADQEREVFEWLWYGVILGQDTEGIFINPYIDCVAWSEGVTEYKHFSGPRKRPQGRRSK